MLRAVLIVLWIVVCIVLTIPLLLFETVYHFVDREASELQSQAVARFLMKGVLRISGARVTVKGTENIPKGEGVLFVPNHRSYFDFVLTFSYITPLYNIGKKELGFIPLFGQWVWLIGTLLLDRSSRKKGYKIIERAAEEVKTGKNMLIYPEGTRNKGKMEEPLRFREGSLKISTWSGCKVIPVAMLYTRDIYENHRPFVKPTDVKMIFGTPIDPAALSEEEKKSYGKLCRDTIVQMMLEEEKNV